PSGTVVAKAADSACASEAAAAERCSRTSGDAVRNTWIPRQSGQKRQSSPLARWASRSWAAEPRPDDAWAARPDTAPPSSPPWSRAQSATAPRSLAASSAADPTGSVTGPSRLHHPGGPLLLHEPHLQLAVLDPSTGHPVPGEP